MRSIIAGITLVVSLVAVAPAAGASCPGPFDMVDTTFINAHVDRNDDGFVCRFVVLSRENTVVIDNLDN